MAETYFIGDTHFGHKGMIAFEAIKPYRPFATMEEHNETLVERWNSVVRKQDSVWHLGDFCFGKQNLEIASRLNGTKRLVMGNHDQYPASDYLKYFTRVCGVAEFHGIILSHIPVHESQKARYRANIHGHLHNKVLIDDWHFNVSAEQNTLTPISYADLQKKLPAQKEIRQETYV